MKPTVTLELDLRRVETLRKAPIVFPGGVNVITTVYVVQEKWDWEEQGSVTEVTVVTAGDDVVELRVQ